MRLLADENFPFPAVHLLRALGHNVLWARTDFPGLKDRALLERAEATHRLVLTFDKDLWQLALKRRYHDKQCSVILFRAYPPTPQNLERIMIATLHQQENTLEP